MNIRASVHVPLVRKMTVGFLIISFLVSPFSFLFAEEEIKNDTLPPVVQENTEEHPPSRPDAIDVVAGRASYDENTSDQADKSLEGNPQARSSDPSPVVYTPENALTTTTAKRKPQTDLSSGALTYSYPIDVPPGRNGMTPDITFSYNNQADQHPSYVGDRWNLSIPYIHRLNKTGSEKLYTSTTFASSRDGELVHVSGTEYAPKVENGDFLKYNYDGTSWTVTDKKGTIYSYGTTTSSRQDDPADSTKVYAWMLETVRDTNNNFIRYSYYKNGGEIYPEAINYGGNGTTAGIFDVVFAREAYSSTTASAPYLFYPNFKVTTAYRIKTITVKANNEWVKKYDLGYTAGDAGYRALLASVTASGHDPSSGITTILPPETFSYKPRGQIGWETPQISHYILPLGVGSGRENNFLQMQDLNGDTYPDVAYSANYSTPGVHLNNTINGWGDNVVSTWELPLPFKDWNVYFRDYGTRIFDVNGDMRNDMVRSFAPTMEENPTESEVYLNNKDMPGWTENTTITVPIGFIFGNGMNADSGIRIADINADGFPDIIKAYLIEDNDSHVNPIPAHIERKAYLGTGSGWEEAPAGTWEVPFPFIDQNPSGPEVYTYAQLVDINGDRLPDIIWQHSQYSYISWPENGYHSATFINNGHGWEPNNPDLWQVPYLTPFENDWYLPWGLSDAGARESDMNGDNMPDILMSRQNGSGNSESRVKLNSGNPERLPWPQEGAYGPEIPLNAPEYFAGTTGSTNNILLFGDANADGMNDMLVGSQWTTNMFRTSLGKPNNFTDTLVGIATPEGGSYAFTYKLS
ncbi:MAG: SpvB/TcaC N-terminal domain-containing protein, partial [Patescibacteria group bacterium]